MGINKEMVRESLITKLGDKLWANSYGQSAFYGKRMIKLISVSGINGPRAGVLKINAGLHADRLYSTLTSNKFSKLRPLFPILPSFLQKKEDKKETWLGSNSPSVYYSGAYLCIEAPWPIGLQTTKIPLSSIPSYPKDGRTFTLGMSQSGEFITLSIDEQTTQNLLFGGMSGSGKSYAIRTTVSQLARNKESQFVLLDGKQGQGAGILHGIKGQIGPIAMTANQVTNALGWCLMQTRDRNRQYFQDGAYHVDVNLAPLFIVFDEFDEYTMINDAIAQLVYLLVKQGRSANVHLLFATQSPKQDMFGNTGTRAQFGGRLALTVSNRHESEAIIGATEPRADRLQGSGDSFVVAAGLRERVQVAYVTKSELAQLTGGEPEFSRWPKFDLALISEEEDGQHSRRKEFSNEESLVLTWAALHNLGREGANRLMRRVLGYKFGSDRMDYALGLDDNSHSSHTDRMTKLWRELENES